MTVVEAIERGFRRLSAGMSDLAGWLYLLGACFVAVNVITRRFLGFSSPGLVEITGYLLAFGISLGLAHSLATKAHIRVDVLVRRLPLRLRAYMHALALAFLAGFGGLLAVRAWSVAELSWRLGSKDTTALEVPLVVPQTVWLFGLLVFASLAVLMAIRVTVLLATSRHEELDALLTVREEEEAAAVVEELTRAPAAQRES